MNAEEKRLALKQRHPDVEFLSGKGRKVKLTFEKNEYRAYVYDNRFGRWEEMKLGSLDTKTLADYIVKNF